MKLKFVAGNRIDLLDSGREYFPALLAALAKARREVFLEAYIFAQDATAHAVVEGLCSAAQRGAKVHVLVDGFGSREMPPEFRARLAQCGVRVLDFRPPVIWQPVRGLRRMHRKIVVIDATRADGPAIELAGTDGASNESACAFVGGINVIDDWNAPNEVPPRFDYAVKVQGPLVAEIQAAARHMWAIAAAAGMRARRLARVPVAPPPPSGDVAAALAIRDNLLHRTEIEDAYLGAIRMAQSTIWLASGYFLPSRRFVRALRAAALRGVAVTIVMQGPSDHPLLKAATQSLYRSLLSVGIRIVEYSKSFLHAKVAVVDDAWATVGSSNIDPFSLLLSREANIVITHASFAVQLRASLEQAIAAGGAAVTLADLARAPWYARLAQWLAYRLARVTVDFVAPNASRAGRRLV